MHFWYLVQSRSMRQPLAPLISTSHLAGKIDEVKRDYVVSLVGLQVGSLAGSMFRGARDKAGSEPARVRRDKIIVMGGHHHDLRGYQVENFNVAQVLVGGWLIGMRDLGAENRILWNPGSFGHVENQRDVAV